MYPYILCWVIFMCCYACNSFKVNAGTFRVRSFASNFNKMRLRSNVLQEISRNRQSNSLRPSLLLTTKKTALTATNSCELNKIISKEHIALYGMNLLQKSTFLRSFSLIFISELGDKTFWMAALLAAKYGKAVTFAGVMSAVTLMGILATWMGWLSTLVPPVRWGHVGMEDAIAMLTFSYFGAKSILDAYQSKTSDASLNEARTDIQSIYMLKTYKSPFGLSILVPSFVFWKIFYLILSAELGDRSFLTTLAMSTTAHPASVLLGTIFAHSATAAISVLGGSILSKVVPEVAIGYLSGFLFLINAAFILRRIWL